MRLMCKKVFTRGRIWGYCGAAMNANNNTATRRDYIAIINSDERNPIEGLRARDAAEARKQARYEMTNVRGWTKYDGTLSIKVRLA